MKKLTTFLITAAFAVVASGCAAGGAAVQVGKVAFEKAGDGVKAAVNEYCEHVPLALRVYARVGIYKDSGHIIHVYCNDPDSTSYQEQVKGMEQEIAYYGCINTNGVGYMLPCAIKHNIATGNALLGADGSIEIDIGGGAKARVEIVPPGKGQ